MKDYSKNELISRLVKGPDERSLNYELISKTQHSKKKSVDYLFYPIDCKIQTILLQLSR